MKTYITYIIYYSVMFVICAFPLFMLVWSSEFGDKRGGNILRIESSNDSIRTEIRRYKLDSLRLELAIIDADMRNDSIRNDIRQKLQQSKP